MRTSGAYGCVQAGRIDARKRSVWMHASGAYGCTQAGHPCQGMEIIREEFSRFIEWIKHYKQWLISGSSCFFYLSNVRFSKHPNGAEKITSIKISSVGLDADSKTVDVLNNLKQLNVQSGSSHLMDVEFDNNKRNQRFDLRPTLPLIVKLWYFKCRSWSI